MKGFGIMKWANHNEYEGFWNNDKREGEGTQKYINGN